MNATSIPSKLLSCESATSSGAAPKLSMNHLFLFFGDDLTHLMVLFSFDSFAL